MADDKDRYVKGRDNPSLDPTRVDLQAKRDALFGSSFTRDKRGTLVQKDQLDAQNKAIDSREASAYGRNNRGLLTRKEEIDASNAAIQLSKFGTPESAKNSTNLDSNLSDAGRAARVSLNDFGSQASIERSWGKTEPVGPQRNLSGGGAKSGLRPTKKISSFGRGDPTFKSFNPQVFRSGFYRAAVSSAKHFIPQYGLFGTGFHGGAIRIQPMSWQGAFPVMSVQQWDSAGATTSYEQEEEEDE